MPHHCGPWPLMTKPMRGANSGRGVKDVRAVVTGVPAANSCSSCDQLGGRTADQRQAVRVMVPAGAERVSQLRQHGRSCHFPVHAPRSSPPSGAAVALSASSERAEITSGHERSVGNRP